MNCLTSLPTPTPERADRPAAPHMSTTSPSTSLSTPMVRPAEPRDVPAIVGLITALAEYEQLTHLLEVTVEKLEPHLFGDRPAAQCLVAEVTAGAAQAGGVEGDGEVEGDGDGDGDGDDLPATTIAGFALYFSNYSTFLARPGIYLEDLFVLPQHRGTGLGRALLARLAEIAVERGCGRLEWSVLDWNQPAIDFYQGLGARVMPEWRICRVTADALPGFGR
jgi:GNAT superfamily N-acetyltransferase